MKTIKQFSESKATDKGERDVGSKAYTDYVIDLTPGAVSNKDAKKSDRETKKTNALKIHRATRLDDATDPEIEQANAQYEREKDELRKQHIKNVANIRSNKIGEEVEDEFDYKAKKGAIAAPGSGSIAKPRKAKASDANKSIEQQMADARKEGWVELDPADVLIEYDQDEVEITEMTPKERRAQELRIKPSAWQLATQKKEPASAGGGEAKKQRRQRAGPGMVGVRGSSRHEEVEEDATYSERISSDVSAGNASGAKGTSKVRKYRQITPGQVRDYEKLTAARMFQAYEDTEIDEKMTPQQRRAREGMRTASQGKAGRKSGTMMPARGDFSKTYDRKKQFKKNIGPQGTPAGIARHKAERGVKKVPGEKNPNAPRGHKEEVKMEAGPANQTAGVANWDPLLGGENSPRVYVRKRRKIDARSKDYREAIKRTQARRDAVAAREAEHKLNMFGVQSNPFKEETEMKNKKYLITKEGSLESAAIESVMTEPPVNPNDARPTLHLPNKYLASKADSLESVVTEVMTERDVSGEMRVDLKRLTGPQFRGKYRMSKSAAMTAGGGITHKGGRAVLRPHREEVEVDETHAPGAEGLATRRYKLPRQLKDPKKEKMVGTKSGTKVVDKNDPKYKKHPEHESVEMTTELDQKQMPTKKIPNKLKPKSLIPPNKAIPEKGSKAGGMHYPMGDEKAGGVNELDQKQMPTKKIPNKLDPKSLIPPNKTMKEKGPKAGGMHYPLGTNKAGGVKEDSRRTDDAIDAYDKSKDASRDADWDTTHGKKKKGDKEKKYAKKERGEIKKDDPDWKHKKGHTGMHGEEMSPLIQATVNELKKKTYGEGRPDLVDVDETSKEKAGRYIQKSADSSADAAMALQRTTDKPGGQTRDDVKKHVGTLMKRRKGREMAIRQLTKNEYEPQGTEIDEGGAYGSQAAADRGLKRLGIKPDKTTETKTKGGGILRKTTYKGKIKMGEDKLSYKERQNLPTGAFALPGKGSGPEGKQGGSYPIPDASHARNALARVSQHGSEAEKATVRRAVHKKFPDIKVSESVMRDLLTVELDETHTSKDRSALDKAIDAYKEKGGKTTVLKPGTRLKGMDPSRKAVIKARRSNEEVEGDMPPAGTYTTKRSKVTHDKAYYPSKKDMAKRSARIAKADRKEEVEIDESGKDPYQPRRFAGDSSTHKPNPARDAAHLRDLRKMAAERKKKEAQKEEVEIDEARSIDSAMSIISSIVKNKQAGEIIHGDRKKSKVDLYSASAIQQVYNALNRKNQEKMEKVISKNRQGLAKMADFSMSMMK